MALGGNWFKLISLGVFVGAGFSVGTYLAKALIGGLQNVSGFSPPLASYAADVWSDVRPQEEASIPYRSYQGAAKWPRETYGELNEIPYVPYASADYTFDF